MIFNGLLLQATDVIWPFRAIAYCSNIRYTLKLLMYCAFIDAEYGGTVRCEANDHDYDGNRGRPLVPPHPRL